MWLGPDEPSVHQVNFIQPFESLEADGQQLPGLQAARHPTGGRLKVPGGRDQQIERVSDWAKKGSSLIIDNYDCVTIYGLMD